MKKRPSKRRIVARFRIGRWIAISLVARHGLEKRLRPHVTSDYTFHIRRKGSP